MKAHDGLHSHMSRWMCVPGPCPCNSGLSDHSHPDAAPWAKVEGPTCLLIDGLTDGYGNPRVHGPILAVTRHLRLPVAGQAASGGCQNVSTLVAFYVRDQERVLYRQPRPRHCLFSFFYFALPLLLLFFCASKTTARIHLRQ